MNRIVVGIAGGTAAGKTTVCNELIRKLGNNSVTYIECDSYYKDLRDIPYEKREELNLDHPDAIEFELLISHLKILIAGHSVQAPVFDFSARQRGTQIKILHPNQVILIDGILLLVNKELRNLIDIKVYLSEDPDIRLIRRLIRDTTVRNRTMESIIKQYLKTVRPMHNELVEPSKEHADIKGISNQETIDQIYETIVRKLAI